MASEKVDETLVAPLGRGDRRSPRCTSFRIQVFDVGVGTANFHRGNPTGRGKHSRARPATRAPERDPEVRDAASGLQQSWSRTRPPVSSEKATATAGSQDLNEVSSFTQIARILPESPNNKRDNDAEVGRGDTKVAPLPHPFLLGEKRGEDQTCTRN